MENPDITTVADPFWVSVTTFYKIGYYHDYITNPVKRIQTCISGEKLGDQFWKDYVCSYKTMCYNEELIIRAKVVTDDTVTLYQIYKSRQHRINFLSNVDTSLFYDNISLDFSEIEYALLLDEKDKLVSKIITSNKVIIQHCILSHRKQGMVIGDPLKGDTLIKVD